MTRYLKSLSIIVSIVVLASVVGTTIGRTTAGSDAAARDSLAVALQGAKTQRAVVDSLTRAAAAAERRAAAEALRADSLERRAVRTRIQYVTVRETAPAECAGVVAAADTALATADSAADSLRGALRSSQEAANDYRAGKDSALAALERLRAAGTAVQATHRSSLLPRVGIGAAAGFNPLTGRPAAVTGITFGWSF